MICWLCKRRIKKHEARIHARFRGRIRTVCSACDDRFAAMVDAEVNTTTAGPSKG